MTTKAIKKQIHKAIDIVESQTLLKAIYMVLDQELKNSKVAVKAFTMEEFYSRNNQSQKEIKQGKLIAHKSVKARYAERQ